MAKAQEHLRRCYKISKPKETVIFLEQRVCVIFKFTQSRILLISQNNNNAINYVHVP